MKIEVELADYADVAPLRELYRHEANCQIVHDSSMRRGFTQPYRILVDGRLAGYAAVFIKHYPGRLMEFHVFPHYRDHAEQLLLAVIETARPTEMEAQSNMPHMSHLLDAIAHDIVATNTLFEDSVTTELLSPGAEFRARRPGDRTENSLEPEGDRVLELEGQIVSNGGYLCHYNPPYGDVYMETSEAHRRKGYGSFLVQEIKRACYENGKKPAARCDPDNIASRKTLECAGFRVCGSMLVGQF